MSRGQPARICDHCSKMIANPETCLISYDNRGEQVDYCNRDCLIKHDVVHPKKVSDDPYDGWHYTMSLAEGFKSWEL